MAISANAVWEIRSDATASNVNGGFFVTGASGVDYSQTTTAQFNLTSCTSAGVDAVILHTGATTTMVGNGAHVISGTNATPGWYEITSVTPGVSMTLDRNWGTGAVSDGVVNIGGAISLAASNDDAVFENGVAGNIFYIKNGTYALGGAVSIAAAGSISGAASSYIRMEGYGTTRGDRPTGSTRPIINTAANNFVISGAAWEVRNIQFTGTSAIMFNYTGNVGRMIDCKFTNTSTTASRIAVQLAANSHINRCELISYRGTAYNANGETQMFGCYVHDSNIGATLPSTTGGSHIINCIFAANVTSCVHVNAVSVLNNTIMNNVFFGGSTNKTGIGINSTGATTYCMWVVNNIFYGLVTGITTATTVGNSMINYDDFNCFAFNTTNVTNWTLGPNSITTTPTFASVGQVTGATATTSGNDLVQSGATFVTNGVTAGRDFVYIVSGTGVTVGVYGITNVTETTLTLDIAPGTSAVADKVFQITTGRNFAVTSSNVTGTGYPGTLPGALTVSYADIGAAQRGSNTYTDPGIANVKINTNYVFSDITLTGSYTGADRWSDPGAANVLSGTSYLVNAATTTGSYHNLNSTNPGITNVRNGTSYIISDVTYTGSLVTPTAVSGTAGTVNIGQLKENIRSVLSDANTTTASVDLSANLSTRVLSIMKVNPEKIRPEATIYPCVTVFLSNKAIEMKTIASNQQYGKRRADLTFSIVGLVWNDTTADYREDPADNDAEYLMENIELILRSHETLGANCNWQFPSGVSYHSVSYDEQTHFRVGIIDLKCTVYY